MAGAFRLAVLVIQQDKADAHAAEGEREEHH
eukprot:CAMPEP_0171796658 /NCGR_PEP_ID=MMETSP0991-20121206/69467_1 /TAXON_ID=483369 /ORGANISM="non described non described, Strain CCMP2098" /LENGTH=30 /DNA_ID= /DNA_START= /DNA_END= /DNA_ORIENTATION=